MRVIITDIKGKCGIILKNRAVKDKVDPDCKKPEMPGRGVWIHPT